MAKVDPRWIEEFRQWRDSGAEGAAPGAGEALAAYLQLLKAEGIEPDAGDAGHVLAFRLALRHGYLTGFLQHKGGRPTNDGAAAVSCWLDVERARRRHKPMASVADACRWLHIPRCAYYRAKKTAAVNALSKVAKSIGFDALAECVEPATERKV